MLKGDWAKVMPVVALLLLLQLRRNGAYNRFPQACRYIRVQRLCESRGGRPGLSVLTSLLVSVDVKLY